MVEYVNIEKDKIIIARTNDAAIFQEMDAFYNVNIEKKIFKSGGDRLEFKKKLDWCDEHCQARWTYGWQIGNYPPVNQNGSVGVIFLFEKSADAVMFRLILE